jgi:hypothetical protein
MTVLQRAVTTDKIQIQIVIQPNGQIQIQRVNHNITVKSRWGERGEMDCQTESET